MTEPAPGLLGRVLLRFGGGAAALAALFFGTAGTLDYWQAWMFLATLFLPMTFVLIYLLRRDPALLERRIRAREPLSAQRAIVSVASLVILLAFVIPGLDRRFGWSNLPTGLAVAADLGVLTGYGLFFLVIRENSYAARTVEVEAGQRVITTGPYRRVRHPMYVAVITMYLLSPLALGSAWGVLPALLLPPLIVRRIVGEERLLAEALPGYRAYMQQTRSRLIPGLW